jgi:HAD superfamily hydrolase (TIGR01662 family)
VSRRALFLDWGGTLVRTRNHRTVLDADGRPCVMPNVPETLARVRPDYDACFIVSNQGRIARGELTERDGRERFRWLHHRLGEPFTDWRICPHDDADRCPCRKPAPALFLDLAAAWDLELARSVHVGDCLKDCDAAGAAGVGIFRWAHEFFGWANQA